MKLNKILITTMLGFTLGLTGCATEKTETPDTPTTEVETPTVTEDTVDLGNGQKAINLSEEETLQYQAGDVIVVEGDTVEFPDQLTLENNGLVCVHEEDGITKDESGDIVLESLDLRIHGNDIKENEKQHFTYDGYTYITNDIKKIYIVEYDTIEYIDNGKTLIDKDVRLFNSDGELSTLVVPFINSVNQKTK